MCVYNLHLYIYIYIFIHIRICNCTYFEDFISSNNKSEFGWCRQDNCIHVQLTRMYIHYNYHMHICKYVNKHTYIYIYIYIHIYIYIYICMTTFMNENHIYASYTAWGTLGSPQQLCQSLSQRLKWWIQHKFNSNWCSFLSEEWAHLPILYPLYPCFRFIFQRHVSIY